MAKDKKSFIAYCDWKETFDALPDEKAGQLVKHLFAYVNDENPQTNDVLINAVFANIKLTLKRDLQKYEGIRKKNTENAQKRWDAKNATASDRMRNDAKNADSDNDSDNVNGNDSVNEKKNKNILLSKVDESTLDDKEKKYYQIAFSFWELVKNNLSELDIKSPATEQAKFKTWVDPVRLLIEKDKKTLDEFREIFRFLQVDEFWKEQIRATSKLRQKNKDNEMYFDVLLIKARNNEKKQSSQNNNSGVSEDYKKSILNRLLHSESSETT